MTVGKPVKNMLWAAMGLAPWLKRTPSVPRCVIRYDHIVLDPAHIREYSMLTGLRYGNTVPLTYPFVLAFPAVMELISRFDFPFSAVGLVHTENQIHQVYPISLSDRINLEVHADQLREHRQGMLVDVCTNVYVGRRLSWVQKTTFLHHQTTSLSSQSPSPHQQAATLPPPVRILHIKPQHIRQYALMSGDINPIHTTMLGARLFGFPTVIAHGMYSAAQILSNVEAQLSPAVHYSTRFHKPLLLPAHPGLYVEHHSQGWDLVLRNIAQQYPYVSATIRTA